jgi:hypothetical protein
MRYLQNKLAHNTHLTDAQKQELTGFFEQQYQENVGFRAAEHAGTIAAFQKIAGDATLTTAQKKAAIQQYVAGERSEMKAHQQAQRQELKQELQQFRPPPPVATTTPQP